MGRKLVSVQARRPFCQLLHAPIGLALRALALRAARAKAI
jgi:hypothetical protein